MLQALGEMGMRRAVAIMIAAGTVLAACGAAGSDETTDDGSQTASSTATADLSDGLITCAMPDYDGKSGLTTTQPFILIDGQAKRYAQFQNVAFDLCEPGQEGCSLEVADGAIDMTYTSPNGVASRYRVDLSSMDIEAWEMQPGEAERSVSFAQGAKCLREPLPEGIELN